jgi:hypothetical protein
MSEQRIRKIEDEIDKLYEIYPGADYAKIDKLYAELLNLDPWNDRFHINCENFPDCELMGCGKKDEKW